MQHLIGSLLRTPARLQTDTRCRALVQDADGGVHGVVVQHDGEERSVRARRGVILTTGGFINNREMLAEQAPLLTRCNFRVGAEGDDGSGIAMGMGAGAAAKNLAMGSISLPLIPPKSIYKGILINAQGQRFINEDAYMGRLGEYAVLHADGRAWMVLDDRSFVRPEYPRELAAVGETPAELERELGLPEGSLCATLDLYNRHAERGEDPVFHKAAEYVTPLAQGPYGAFDCTTEKSLYAAFTLGGLLANRDGELLTLDGEAVPGLYGAGRATACLAAPGYSSGLSIGDGTFFGRRAGRHAAARRP